LAGTAQKEGGSLLVSEKNVLIGRFGALRRCLFSGVLWPRAKLRGN